MKRKLNITICLLFAFTYVFAQKTKVDTIEGIKGKLVFEIQDIPEGVVKKGHSKDAEKFGYRIPSLLVTDKGTTIAFTERRLGLHDHAQNDIVLKRSVNGGKTWGAEIVAIEDGMNSINDPLTVQLSDGRIMMMFARFPYGRHARNSGWIKMAEPGYDDPLVNVRTYITYSSDDGLTWSKPQDISKYVKPNHWLNANTPGAMIQLERGLHKGRIVTSLWGTVPVKDGKKVSRTWEIVSAWSDDLGKTWKRSATIEDPERGYPNECQIVEAANGNLIIISRNQGGEKKRKKSFSKDRGKTWSALETDPTLPSVACMGSIVKGPKKKNGSWDLYASFPSKDGRKNGQIAVSNDNGKSFSIKKIIKGSFAYSATQISANGKNLELLYEADKYKTLRFLVIPLIHLK